MDGKEPLKPVSTYPRQPKTLSFFFIVGCQSDEPDMSIGRRSIWSYIACSRFSGVSVSAWILVEVRLSIWVIPTMPRQLSSQLGNAVYNLAPECRMSDEELAKL